MSANSVTPAEEAKQQIPATHKQNPTTPPAKASPHRSLTHVLSSLKDLLSIAETLIVTTQQYARAMQSVLAHLSSLTPDPSTQRSLGAQRWQLMLLEDKQADALEKKREVQRYVDRVEKGEASMSAKEVKVLLIALANAL
ncbi:hypothetical protein EKO04_001334 [Ascochyta lentis]|uniref:Uncharacterized protein n=1 Tax=Ascochyta lentis TaxID=205686 RepID=A0A8H7J9U4_9PLEO|nr:hypothetical protein EKO04_001334 [Ascochyta lentis]